MSQIELFTHFLYFKLFNWNPIGLGCRIHQLHLCRGIKKTFLDECRYDIKQFDGEALVMLELWEMQSTHSLPLLPGLLWPRVVAPDRILSMGQIEQFDI